MVRLPDSEGLRGLLKDDVPFQAQPSDIRFQAQPSDVRSRKFDIEFSLDERGNRASLELWIAIETDVNDFKPSKSEKVGLYRLRTQNIVFFCSLLSDKGNSDYLLRSTSLKRCYWHQVF